MRYLFLFITCAVLVWSGIAPKDRFTWFLEAGPVLIGMPLAIWIDRRYKMTSLVFILLCIQGVMLCIGGKYTYAEVPVGFYFKEMFDLSRNHYDRLGHFMQGFGPAIVFRELLIRNKAITATKPKILFLVVTSFCLSFSAIYEFIEWLAATITADGAQDFLGTQGDVWDAQWDMFLALLGGILSLLTLSRLHDRQLRDYKPANQS